MTVSNELLDISYLETLEKTRTVSEELSVVETPDGETVVGCR